MLTQEQIIVEVLKKHKIIRYKGLFRDCMIDAMNEYASLEPSFTLEDIRNAIETAENFGRIEAMYHNTDSVDFLTLQQAKKSFEALLKYYNIIL